MMNGAGRRGAGGGRSGGGSGMGNGGRPGGGAGMGRNGGRSGGSQPVGRAGGQRGGSPSAHRADGGMRGASRPAAHGAMPHAAAHAPLQRRRPAPPMCPAFCHPRPFRPKSYLRRVLEALYRLRDGLGRPDDFRLTREYFSADVRNAADILSCIRYLEYRL